MSVIELVRKNRSYRRFDQSVKIEDENLRGLINLARLSASSANQQPLKYIVSNKPEMNSVIFSHLAWAGYLEDWDGPEQGERPSAYIIILGDKSISPSVSCDHGIAAQSILLGGTEMGLGGCIIGSIKKDKLRKDLKIPPQYKILLVIALGVPVENVVIEPLGPDGDIRYWRDDDGTHHVPKRSLDEIIIN
jgi:nitroreductase